MDKKKYLLILIGLIATVLIITNPTNADFDNYLHAKGFDKSVPGGRVNYFLFYSVYEVKFKYGSGDSQTRFVRCIGIFKNFITTVDTE